MFQSQVQEVQITLDEAKKKVKLGEALERLERNKDFKLIFEEEFFKQESIRQVSLLSCPNHQEPHKQAAIIADMRASATVQSFFNLLRRNARMSEQAVQDSEDQLAQLRAQDDE